MTNQIKSNFELLAKSEPKVTLKQHIEDCIRIEKQLECCFPNIPIDNKSMFWNIVQSAIIFHDTGKSHRGFQKMLYCGGKFSQRHELFSLFFINQSDLIDYVKELVLYAVLGHHKDLDTIQSIVFRDYTQPEMSNFVSFDTTTYDKDCDELLKNKTWKILQDFNCKKREDSIIDIVDTVRNFKKENHPLGSSPYLLRLLLVGFLKQCDHLASAGFSDLHSLSCDDFGFLHEYSLYHHQDTASKADGSAFLSSPTGSGKTETSLLWLERQIKIHGQGRVFYVLPYTASINAMYERLNKVFGESRKLIGMLHGKLAQYFENKFEDCRNENLTKIEEFRTLVTPFKVVTPFQMLKNLFGIKGFEKGIAEWCGGYFIFDEIHAYDSKTLAQIVVLLEYCTKWFNVSVFIMTATMPSFMLDILSNALNTKLTIKANKSLYKDFDRHIISVEEGSIVDSLNIQRDIDNGKKVLVVCNTVEQAQNMYKRLICNSKLLLHGSFNANDRSSKEKKLNSEEVQLLVGTQAIEVSLDIDYDTIYTEPAPIDALIQRFGRVNRKRKKGLCICHVFKESNEKDRFIYDQEVVKRSINALDNIGSDKVLHEYDIQQMIDFVYPDFEEKQKHDYDETYNCLKIGIEERLQPLLYDEKSENDFYNMFEGIKVLPVSLLDEYRNSIEQNRFIHAEGLLVSIRESRFNCMYHNEDIYKNRICYEKKDDTLAEKTILVINRKYSKEYGLLIDEEEKDTLYESQCL